MISWPGIADDDRGVKRRAAGSERTIDPEQTLKRVRGLWPLFGITRVANLTGLDHLGVPVMAAYRPNSRAIAVAQGKGLTVAAAKASAVMESIETFHAERMTNPLRVTSVREMTAQPGCLDLQRLTRIGRPLDIDRPIIWVSGQDLPSGRETWLPWEVVHTDYTVTVPGGSDAFLCTSNGLASGNHFWEAVSHGICEVIERDGNALFHVAPPAWAASRRIDLSTVPPGPCSELMDRILRAGALAMVWETTTDVGVPSFVCKLADRDERGFSPVIPIAGSGCHPRREVAFVRAVTEAAQGRITRIASAREDLADALYDPDDARAHLARFNVEAATPATRSFSDVPTFESDSVADDVDWEVRRLAAASFEEIAVVDLTRRELGIPVVRVVIPGLEGPHETEGRVPGARQIQWQSRQPA